MVGVDEIRSRLWQAVGRAFLIAAASAFVPGLAHAHFILIAPDSWMSQDSFGLPEKLGPCGDEGGGTPTAAVTAFRSGQAISVTINEVIAHPGHYRVALAVNDRSELPPEPTVTPKAGDPCGSAAIQNPPTFPILADNVLPHTGPFPGPQTFTVTLPTDVTCAKCTLQVLEFMSSHPAPCFYHHCADISIQPVGDCNLDGTFNLFEEPYVLFGPTGGVGQGGLVTGTFLYLNSFVYFNFGYGAAIAWIVALIIFVLSMLQLRVGSRNELEA